MPIRVDCLTCRKWYKAPDKAAGKVVKCPGCGAELKVPADAPPIAEAPKAPGSPSAAPAKPVPPPVPAPETSSFEDDDPFSIPGFPSILSASTASASPSGAPPRPLSRRPAGKKFDVGGLGGSVGRFVVANPLLVLVGAVASLLLAIGLFVRGQWFGVGGVLALVGYGLVAMGLFLPPPKPRRPVRRENSGGGGSIFNPFAAGGIGLVGVLGVIGRGLGRVNGRGNQGGNGGGNALPGREFNPVGLAIGLGTFALVIGAIVGLFMSIRRYGLYATLAPIYVGIGGLLGLVMVISIGSDVSRMPRGFRPPSQPPALRSVAEPVP